MITLALTSFSHGDGCIEAIQSTVSSVERNRLRFTYRAVGDMGKLIIPAQSAARRADRLWEHTCFEAFLRAGIESAYYEFNFSPSGEWAVYAFRGYREAAPALDDGAAPEIVVRRYSDRLELDAVVRLDRLPALGGASLLRIGLSAVIEASDGALSYWALKHPAAKPDFHHADSFALELALPERSA